MATTALFTGSELTLAVREYVADDEAAMAERVVWGWLSPILGLEERPDPITPQLFSWAIQLGAHYYENPTGLSAYQLGEERRQYGVETRDAILDEVRGSVDPGTGAGSDGLPRGRFPAASSYPDPIRVRGINAYPTTG